MPQEFLFCFTLCMREEAVATNCPETVYSALWKCALEMGGQLAISLLFGKNLFC